MTRTEALKNELLTAFGASVTYFGYDNPFNASRSHTVVHWIMPPEIPVSNKDVPVTVSIELRTFAADVPTLLSELGKKFQVYDITELYLPPGAMSVDNAGGYLYKFKIKWVPCLSGL